MPQPVLDSTTPSGRPGAASIGALSSSNGGEGANSSISSSSNLRAAIAGDGSSGSSGLSQPAVVRAISEPCKIPRAPRMACSQPDPLFLEGLQQQQLALPPPSVEEGDDDTDPAAAANGSGGLSASLRERSAALAAGFARATAATSCPSAFSSLSLSWPWPRAAAAEEEEDASAAGSSGHSSLGTSPSLAAAAGLEPGPQSLAALRGSSLTALELLVSRKLLGATGAGDASAAPGGDGTVGTDGSPALGPVLTAVAIPGSLGEGGGRQEAATAFSAPAAPAHHSIGKHPGAGAGVGGAYSCSASTMPTTTTATTTVAGSVSSHEDEEDEEEVGGGEEDDSTTASSLLGGEGQGARAGVSADAAMGPFDLEELSI